MIVDTSALVAVFRREPGFEALLSALTTGQGLVPTPVLVEFHRVIALADNVMDAQASAFLDELLSRNLSLESFTTADAEFAAAANQHYGTGNGRGGTLNLLDLMAYGMAKRTGRPILCTGRDFAATDAAIHAASRTEA